jgi:succinate dehydrogenase/fumarate reductase flavoprotein subunit
MKTIANLDKLRNAKGEHSTLKIRSALQKTIQRNVAEFRRQDI